MSLNPERPAMTIKLHISVSRCSLDVGTKLVRNLETNRNVYLICSSACEQWVVSCLDESESRLGYSTPPQRLPLGIPVKIAIIEKNKKRAGHDGKREKDSLPLFSLSSSHHAPRSPFLSPQPPYNTKRPLWRRETGLCARIPKKNPEKGTKFSASLSEPKTKLKRPVLQLEYYRIIR